LNQIELNNSVKNNFEKIENNNFNNEINSFLSVVNNTFKKEKVPKNTIKSNYKKKIKNIQLSKVKNKITNFKSDESLNSSCDEKEIQNLDNFCKNNFEDFNNISVPSSTKQEKKEVINEKKNTVLDDNNNKKIENKNLGIINKISEDEDIDSVSERQDENIMDSYFADPDVHNYSQVEKDHSKNKFFETSIYKRNMKLKSYYDENKQKKFQLSCFELFRFFCCNQADTIIRKKNIFNGGKALIEERTDVVYLIKKMLEFDRFKSLMLNNDQLLLLDSLSKFMLDRECVDISNFSSCNYEKFIDIYSKIAKSDSPIDMTLSRWVNKKYLTINK